MQTHLQNTLLYSCTLARIVQGKAAFIIQGRQLPVDRSFGERNADRSSTVVRAFNGEIYILSNIS